MSRKFQRRNKRNNQNRYKQEITRRCNSTIADYVSIAQNEGFGPTNKTTIADTPHGPLIHIDRGGDVLAIVHLDTVGNTTPKWKGSRVQCTQLDDRLGLWVILDLLPSLTNVKYDILLTDSEEIGESTAQYLESEYMPTQKTYNWVFSFDRAGDDCVLYSYEDDTTENLITSYGWVCGMGAFSDICSVEHLGIKGFNFGTGYHQQHSPACHADIRETIVNAKKFVGFLEGEHTTLLPHVMVEYVEDDNWVIQDTQNNWKDWDNQGYQGHQCNRGSYDEEAVCEGCDYPLQDDWQFCPLCGADILYLMNK